MVGNAAMRIMGMIGDPIEQVKTPAVINPIFISRGANITCIPQRVSAAELEKTWAELKATPNLIGFGITLPHKQKVVELCDSLDPVAERVGAVNVVRRERDGSFRGYQFDGKGFVRGLSANGIRYQDRDVLMIGSGGAAIAIAFALAEANVKSIVIANRTYHKAEALVNVVNTAFGRTIAKVGPAIPKAQQLVINATSLGLNQTDPLPLDPELLLPGMTMAEVIAKPEITQLLSMAESRGIEIHSGIHMIKGQVGLIADHFCEVWA